MTFLCHHAIVAKNKANKAFGAVLYRNSVYILSQEDIATGKREAGAIPARTRHCKHM